jgi:hypothetical protein
MQLGELCQRLDVPYRHARYILERGILPGGVDRNPDRGNHRQLTSAQAFWLGIVLKLKESGVRAPLAGQIADYAEESVRTISQGLSWEPGFQPFEGWLETERQWFVDVGDLHYIRIVTDANPSRRGLYDFDWSEIGKRKRAEVTPVVILRLDLARMARLLRG